MISINNVVPPLTRNVFHLFSTNLIRGLWYTSPPNSISFFNRGFIILEKFSLGSLNNYFLIFTPRQTKRKGSDPTDEFRGYFNGEASNGYSSMSSCMRDQRERKFMGNFIIKPSKLLKEIHPVCPCKYFHHLRMCIEPSGFSGILSHKPSCHTACTFLKTKIWRWRQRVLRKIKKERRLCFFF